MKLFFTGHGEKYAVEQTLLTLCPQERPVYPDAPGGTDGAVVTLRRGARFTADSGTATYTWTTSLPRRNPVFVTPTMTAGMMRG